MLLAGLIGGTVLGLVGALLAIPITAGLKVLLTERLQARDAADTGSTPTLTPRCPAMRRLPRIPARPARVLRTRRAPTRHSQVTAAAGQRARAATGADDPARR